MALISSITLIEAAELLLKSSSEYGGAGRPSVQVVCGKMEGIELTSHPMVPLAAFLGVPYGAPPLGIGTQTSLSCVLFPHSYVLFSRSQVPLTPPSLVAGRWKPSMAAACWNQTLNATRQPKAILLVPYSYHNN